MIIDLSLKNGQLYDGCVIEVVAGRLNLATPIVDAINFIGMNINAIVNNIPSDERDVVILTGPMAVWSYMIVFHAVVHVFREVRYNDGKSEVLIAKHG